MTIPQCSPQNFIQMFFQTRNATPQWLGYDWQPVRHLEAAGHFKAPHWKNGWKKMGWFARFGVPSWWVVNITLLGLKIKLIPCVCLWCLRGTWTSQTLSLVQGLGRKYWFFPRAVFLHSALVNMHPVGDQNLWCLVGYIRGLYTYAILRIPSLTNSHFMEWTSSA